MVFTAISVMVWLAYVNLTTTMGVFLRNAQGIPETGYGWLLSLNAALVVLFQFPITRRIEKQPPMVLMAIGSALLGIGFAMYGFFSTYGLFMAAILVITLGEMIMMPVSNALVVKFAPEDMRGRYSFMYSISWGVAFAAGPYLAGLIMDNGNPNWLWYICGILGIAAALGFAILQDRFRRDVLVNLH
jgi:MFS family permease